MFDWASYLDVAKDLRTLIGGEAGDRSATSRAYYAAFGTARAYAVANGAVLTGTGRDHTLVWDWFIGKFGRAGSQIAQRGRRLKQWWRNADYRNRHPRYAAEATSALIEARLLLADVTTLP